MTLNPTQRFSDRVGFYIKYRPRYPKDILTTLQSEYGLTAGSVMADIGSGTGFLAELFLKNGNPVYGVEPNAPMRVAAEKQLAGYPNFTSIDGTAETTTLHDRSIDFITAGQAFHWFEQTACRNEFRRILKPPGYVVLLWNDRQTDTDEFLQEYEAFLQKYGTDYAQVDHKKIDDAAIAVFFKGNSFQKKQFDNYQHLDYEGLEGRVLSSSYMPNKGHRNFDAMLVELHNLYERFQQNNRVTLIYDTNMYIGRLT